MKIFKRISAVLLCLVLAFSMTLAASAETRSIEISVGSATAVPNDEIAINVDMTKNEGIMAMTFTVIYDTEVLTFKKYNIGVFNDYTIVDHPDKGYVSIVNCEKKDRTYTGNILVLNFTVNEKAPAGKHPIKIGNIRPENFGEDLDGCFATWDKLTVNATVNNGEVDVGKTCSNSGHTMGEWKKTSEPLCESVGVEVRSCEKCNHSENREIKALGHDYSEKWTVDVQATENELGSMSRHCSRCEKTVDSVSFDLEAPTQNSFENKVDATINAESWDKLEQKAEENPVFPAVEEEAGEATGTDVEKDEEEPELDKRTAIIVISAAGVLLIGVIVALLVLLFKKKK